MVRKTKIAPVAKAKIAQRAEATEAVNAGKSDGLLQAARSPVVMVRRKELVERIVARSGLKPNAVKSVLDAVLQEMGDALSAGEGLNLHPFGKVTVNRQKQMEDKEVLICKIRRKLASDSEATTADVPSE
ncbi:MAG: HU family DNA-binding protein [Paracoccaceae bacterium]